ncbi:MAG TPA: sigma-70 family RNA polymerase sigma factor [Caulobacteraceae bacterium]|nr:sigma-70 family RNA polymerase sigma factor [Caulobacteraceae bacterium]
MLMLGDRMLPMAPHKPVDAIAPYADEDIRAWMTQYGPALRRYFQKKVGPNEAEDLVQEVFLSLQVRGSAGRIENVQGYLFRMAANALIRRRERRKWDWSNHEILDDAIEISDEPSPERVLLGKEAVQQLLEALQALPPRYREALFLHRFEEMSYAAIAARMNTTAKAVDHLIQRALKRILEMRDRDQ